MDVERTSRYAEAMRAALYAATRGEADYAAITEEVERALAQLTAIEDPKKRLELAEEAKRRLCDLVARSTTLPGRRHPGARGVFDEVIAELRVAAGESQFSLDLRRVRPPVSSRSLPLPTLRESIALALAAAAVADVSRGSRSPCSGPSVAARSRSGPTTTCADHGRPRLECGAGGRARLRDALAATRSPGGRRDAAGDVDGVRGSARDSATRAIGRSGERRPQQVAALLATLEASSKRPESPLALDHYAYVRRDLLDYERGCGRRWPAFDGLIGARVHPRHEEHGVRAARAVRTSGSSRLQRISRA